MFPRSLKLSLLQVAQYVEGGWIQRFKPSTYAFPDSEKALSDAIESAGPTLGPLLLSMSEFLMSSFNESYQSRCVLVEFLTLFSSNICRLSRFYNAYP